MLFQGHVGELPRYMETQIDGSAPSELLANE
jgi:hypothetical protein